MSKILSNSKMGNLVARLIGKPELTVRDGKVELTDTERDTVRANYGDAFLSRLEAATMDEDSQAHDLFDAAVSFKTAELAGELKQSRELVEQLRSQILTLASEPEPAPSCSPVSGADNASRFSLDMKAKHNAVALAVMSDPARVFSAANAGADIDVADLNAEFTKAMPPKLRLEIVSQRIYAGFNDAKYMTRVQSNTDYIASVALMSEVSQQFTSEWTPKGKAKFTPSRIPYRRHKINVSIKPAEIIPSWLGYLYEQGKTLGEMPVSLYIINQMILPKLLEDITLSMIGKGSFKDAGAVQEGAAGRPASESMDGYETILYKGKTDPDCKFNFYKAAKDPMSLSDEDLIKYIQGFADAISPLFANKMDIHCSQELLTRYKRADFAVNGKYTGESVGDKVRFTNFNLVPLESMYNSKIIFATPKENFVELVDYSNAQNCIQKVREVDYSLHVIGEYSLSVGFKVQEAVYAAVPDGYDPAAATISDPQGYSDAWETGKAPSGGDTPGQGDQEGA